MGNRQSGRWLFLGALLLLSACAHAPTGKEAEPETLLARACEPGNTVRTAEGSVWMMAKSQEVSGQFPASVIVRAPGTLALEVTNLLGATEANISIKDAHYSIKTRQKNYSQEGYGSWGGIPLSWATQLFLGRIPCPQAQGFQVKDLKLKADKEGKLAVDAPATLKEDAQRYTYQFRTWSGKAWPEALVWERLGALPLKVEFKFTDPETGTGSPLTWEAASPQGKVKVRWRERKTQH